MTNTGKVLDAAKAAATGKAAAADASPAARTARKAKRKAKAPKRTRTTRNSAELRALKAKLNSEAAGLSGSALLERFRLQTIAQVKAGGASETVLKALKKARKARRKDKRAAKAAKAVSAPAPSKTVRKAKAPVKADAPLTPAAPEDILARIGLSVEQIVALAAAVSGEKPSPTVETPVAKAAKARKAALRKPAKAKAPVQSSKEDLREKLAVIGVQPLSAEKIAELAALRKGAPKEVAAQG